MSRECGALAAQQLICGCHVAVPDPETVIQVCNHLRPWWPVLVRLRRTRRSNGPWTPAVLRATAMDTLLPLRGHAEALLPGTC
jgi:hypothetical protein